MRACSGVGLATRAANGDCSLLIDSAPYTICR
jgi:hypothetical protein